MSKDESGGFFGRLKTAIGLLVSICALVGIGLTISLYVINLNSKLSEISDMLNGDDRVVVLQTDLAKLGVDMAAAGIGDGPAADSGQASISQESDDKPSSNEWLHHYAGQGWETTQFAGHGLTVELLGLSASTSNKLIARLSVENSIAGVFRIHEASRQRIVSDNGRVAYGRSTYTDNSFHGEESDIIFTSTDGKPMRVNIVFDVAELNGGRLSEIELHLGTLIVSDFGAVSEMSYMMHFKSTQSADDSGASGKDD